jgi:hypothetical protein
MKRLFSVAFAILGTTSLCVAGAALCNVAAPTLHAAGAVQTWTGFISDSHCGAMHRADIEHGGKITARECVIGREGDAGLPGCVSEKNGAKFVVVVGDKVYQIANQNMKELRTFAAENVKVTGTLNGDTITATTIVAAR